MRNVTTLKANGNRYAGIAATLGFNEGMTKGEK